MILKEYISKNHSKFLIKYHIILVCKYRKQLLVGAVEYDMKKIMRHISEMSDFDIEVMETDKDHLHMMVRSEPKLSPLQIVRRLKQMSTSAVWKKYGRSMEIFYGTTSTKNTLFGLMDILFLQLGMSVKRPSRNILKTKGSCATPYFSSPKLKI